MPPLCALTCCVRTSVRAALAGLGAAAIAFGAETTTNVYEDPLPPVAASPLDAAVFAQLERLHLAPVRCSDGVFVRRVYLDLIGTLPTAKEARDFILDPDHAGKRRQLIDRLLERGEYADYWAMKWADLLRIKAEFPINLWPNAAQAYQRWVRAALADNLPYDRFVRELLTASGSNFRVGPANFYRAMQNRSPEGVASAVALTFMGSRAETWPAERRRGLAMFFSEIGYKPTGEWKEEHVFWDPLGSSRAAGNTVPGRPAIGAMVQAINAANLQSVVAAGNCDQPAPRVALLPDGSEINLPVDRDPREVFADWLITPKNPWFTRAIVNRAWSWFLGRGIVHEPDDLRPDNPPSNPALLARLEADFAASGYDLKALFRVILNSETYQFASTPRSLGPEAEAVFASYALRRLDAEVLIDAVNQITGSSDLYTSPIPEPFTYIPSDMRAIAIADGSITSPFLALFGRSARATGLENERDHKPLPAQWLHLLNSSHMQRKLEQGPALRAVLDSRRGAAAITEDLYLTILSRFPTPDELRQVEAYGQVRPVKPPPAGTNPPAAAAAKPVVEKRREDWLDLAWALLNSTEFLYRH